MMLRTIALAGALALLSAGPAAAADDGFLLRDGDRVVFYGDSITQQQMYTRYVQQYVYTRYPDRNIRFFNAGWGGDTAKGANKRLLRDVLELRPTVVTLLFGMNDARYSPLNEETLATYAAEMKSLVESLTANGARVVVITPGCIDDDKRPGLAAVKYNETLAAFAKAARKLAKDADCLAIDLHTPMLQFQTRRKKADAEFSMIPDGVHPNPAGQTFMAYTILRGLGAEAMPKLGSIDVRSGKGDGLRIVKSDDGPVVLETTEPVLTPVWITKDTAQVAKECGYAEELAARSLVVKGLKSGLYEIVIDKQTVGEAEATKLARGYQIPSRWSQRGQRVHDLIRRKESYYFATWRELRIPYESEKGVDKAIAGLMEADAGLHEMIRAQCSSKKPMRIRLERVPEGANLARGQPYKTTDENKYGWEGGLVDGSWAGDREHCFSTGDDDRFPKSVTVDIGKSQRLAAIRFGVPAFGATRGVKVAVSKNGKQWKKVGEVEFALKREQRKTFWLTDVSARFIRLKYMSHHDGDDVGFSPKFAFTTELEVYGAR